jgi:hypothetical protein
MYLVSCFADFVPAEEWKQALADMKSGRAIKPVLTF